MHVKVATRAPTGNATFVRKTRNLVDIVNLDAERNLTCLIEIDNADLKYLKILIK